MCENSARFTRTVAFTATKLAHHTERSHRHRQSVGLCLRFVCQGRQEGESSLDLLGAFIEIESGLIDSGQYDEALSRQTQCDACGANTRQRWETPNHTSEEVLKVLPGSSVSAHGRLVNKASVEWPLSSSLLLRCFINHTKNMCSPGEWT